MDVTSFKKMDPSEADTMVRAMALGITEFLPPDSRFVLLVVPTNADDETLFKMASNIEGRVLIDVLRMYADQLEAALPGDPR